MTEYLPGETISVTNGSLHVREIRHDPRHGRFLVCEKKMKDGSVRQGSVFIEAPDTVVERVAPADGAPQPGDLWRDKSGMVWFAVDVHGVDETDVPDIRLVRAYDPGEPEHVSRTLKLYGPLTLIHREPEPSVDEEVPW